MLLLAKYLTFAFCCSILIWWSSSMGAETKDGALTSTDATSLTIEMSVLMTVLTVTAWSLSARVHRTATRVRLSAAVTIETAVILALYVFVVIMWRQHWTPEKGLTESAAFMPVLGHMNSFFFADYGWLQYLLVDVPLASILSGIVTWLFFRIENRERLVPNS
jgi:hypothetical protein